MEVGFSREAAGENEREELFWRGAFDLKLVAARLKGSAEGTTSAELILKDEVLGEGIPGQNAVPVGEEVPIFWLSSFAKV